MSAGALVVGLGQIGMGYDLALDARQYALTHARAFARHPAFRLIGGVDPDPQRRQQFESHYDAPAFADVAAAMTVVAPDVVAIASPTLAHGDSMRAVLAAGAPRAILCEKPLAYDIAPAREIVARCRERNCRLFVNYIRRAEPGAAEVRRRLSDGTIRGPIRGVVWYSKGLLNNGSHFLNLLQYWFGEARLRRVIAPGRLWDGIDPEPDFALAFGPHEIYFLAAREENFSHYTVELVAVNGRLRYEQGGEKIFWQHAAADPAYPGYTVLAPVVAEIATDFNRSQWHVADQLAHALDGRDARICTGDEALQTLELLKTIRTDP